MLHVVHSAGNIHSCFCDVTPCLRTSTPTNKTSPGSTRQNNNASSCIVAGFIKVKLMDTKVQRYTRASVFRIWLNTWPESWPWSQKILPCNRHRLSNKFKTNFHCLSLRFLWVPQFPSGTETHDFSERNLLLWKSNISVCCTNTLFFQCDSDWVPPAAVWFGIWVNLSWGDATHGTGVSQVAFSSLKTTVLPSQSRCPRCLWQPDRVISLVFISI